jgi:hypothetical protein
MKKRNLLKLLVAFLGITGMAFNAKAQSTANVTLDVVINNVTSLTIQGADQTATLTYSTQSDFANGVTTTQPAAMTAVSNQPYSVTVYASGNLLNGASNTIPVDDVTVTPTPSTTDASATCLAVAIPVSAGSALPIIHSSAGTTTQNFDLAYTTAGAPITDFLGKPAGTYTTTLTYTITTP